MKAATACIVMLIACTQSNVAIGCSGEAKPLGNGPIDVSWIKSKLTIYGVDDKGLYEARLDSKEQKQLVEIGQKFSDGLAMSPDGRFLLYSTSQDQFRHGKVHHLFDRTTGKDRVVPVLAKPQEYDQLEFVGFSPDGKRMAWQDDRPSSTWDTPGTTPGLIVFDANSLVRKEFAYPTFGNSSVTARSCFTSQWGADSRSIYSNYLDTKYRCELEATDRHNLSYFKTDVTTGEVVRLGGGYDFDNRKYRFRSFYVDSGKTLRLVYPCHHAHGCAGAYGDRVVAGTSQAWLHHVDNPSGLIDGKEELYVQAAGASPHKIDSGWTSSCSGTDIQMVGWVENGKYLIYRMAGNTYIYGADEAKQSPLPQLSGDYNWLPLDSGAMLYSGGGGHVGENGPETSAPRHMSD